MDIVDSSGKDMLIIIPCVAHYMSLKQNLAN